MRRKIFTYTCFFEGQQEEMYFKYVSKLIKHIRPEVGIKLNKTSKLNTLAKSSTEVPKIAVFDYDCELATFENRVKTCKKSKIRIFYTSLNFDLWLLLHKEKFTKNVSDNADYIPRIRKVYNLNKTDNIKEEKIINKILSQITLDDVKFAIKNCNEIMNDKLEADKLKIGKDFEYYPNPSMSIQEFFEGVLKELGM
jgi:hypothetical protein